MRRSELREFYLNAAGPKIKNKLWYHCAIVDTNKKFKLDKASMCDRSPAIRSGDRMSVVFQLGSGDNVSVEIRGTTAVTPRHDPGTGCNSPDEIRG